MDLNLVVLFDEDDTNVMQVVAPLLLNEAQCVVSDAFEVASSLNITSTEVNTNRVSQFFDEIKISSHDVFQSHFRMKKATMEALINRLRLSLAPHAEERMIVPFEKKVYLTVWILANKTSLREVGNLFDMEKSSVCGIFHEICALLADLRYEVIKWPSYEEQIEIAEYTKSRYGIPNCVGFIDGCHIEIKAPRKNPVDYYNRKETHSIVLQAVCDHTLKFIDIYIGQTGRAHDARIFRESPLADEMDNLLLDKGFHILGDSAYTLQMNLMIPYRDDGMLTRSQIYYNKIHAKARSTIERAFGRLKTKFRRLKYLEMHKEVNIPVVICASCVLHNFILMYEKYEENYNQFNLPNIDFLNANTPKLKRDRIKDYLGINMNIIHKLFIFN